MLRQTISKRDDLKTDLIEDKREYEKEESFI
jgi:hypothetical protein